MRCTVRFRVLTLGFLLFQSLSAQTATPISAQEHNVTAQSSEFQLSVTVNTVLVDVVVSDRDGRPVRNLHREDFQVFEDGVSQKITFFETPAERSQETLIPLLPLGKDVYSNFIDAPVTASVDVLLLDALNTEGPDQAYLRNELLRYLQKMKSGHPVAVFLLSSKLSLLQPPTTDPAPLLEVLKSHAADPKQTAFLATDDDILQANKHSLNFPQMRTHLEQALRDFQADAKAFRQEQRAQMTISAFQQLNRYLGDIPGRKNILWFSAAFPLYLLPDIKAKDHPDLTGKDTFRNVIDHSAELRQLANSLATNRVAIYPIDIRGIPNLPVYDSSLGLIKEKRDDQGQLISAQTLSLQRSDDITSQFLNQSAGEKDTTDLLAKETGGHAIRNTNDLEQAINRILETDSVYYTLSYTPTKREQDGKLRRIEIKVNKKLHYNLSFRSGYYATDQDSRNTISEEERQRLFATSMGHEVPQATEIVFKARVTADSAPNHDQNKLSATTSQKPERLITHCQIDLDASLASVHFAPSVKGVTHGELIIGAIAYGANGEILDSSTKHIAIQVSQGEYTQLLQHGFPYHLDLKLPRGSSWVRIGVYDPISGHLGTLEIPTENM